MRQKGERAAARARIEDDPSRPPGDAPDAERVKSVETQRWYWRIGVTLAWTSAGILSLSILAFLTGGILAGLVLGTT
jgi:hypothetical protein